MDARTQAGKSRAGIGKNLIGSVTHSKILPTDSNFSA